MANLFPQITHEISLQKRKPSSPKSSSSPNSSSPPKGGSPSGGKKQGGKGGGVIPPPLPVVDDPFDRPDSIPPFEASLAGGGMLLGSDEEENLAD